MSTARHSVFDSIDSALLTIAAGCIVVVADDEDRDVDEDELEDADDGGAIDVRMNTMPSVP